MIEQSSSKKKTFLKESKNQRLNELRSPLFFQPSTSHSPPLLRGIYYDRLGQSAALQFVFAAGQLLLSLAKNILIKLRPPNAKHFTNLTLEQKSLAITFITLYRIVTWLNNFSLCTSMPTMRLKMLLK